METRELALQALEVGKILKNSTTKSLYRRNGKGELMYKSQGSKIWSYSDLQFYYSPSWKNMEIFAEFINFTSSALTIIFEGKKRNISPFTTKLEVVKVTEKVETKIGGVLKSTDVRVNKVKGLPDPEDGFTYIVTKDILPYCVGRSDVVTLSELVIE